MKFNIERESNHHLLTVELVKEEVIAYQVKMLQNNALPYLLRPQISSMDEKVCIRYGWGQLLCFGDYIKGQGVDYELIKSVIKSLSDMEEVLKEYLLEEEKLVIDFNMMYLNPENKNCSFVYLPCKDLALDWRQSFRGLIREMMKHVHKQDEKAVGLIHKISIIMEEEFFNLHSLYGVLKMEDEILFSTPIEEKEFHQEPMGKKAPSPKGFFRKGRKNSNEQKREKWLWRSEEKKSVEKTEVIC